MFILYNFTDIIIISNVVSFFTKMWHKVILMENPLRIELTSEGLLV